ncbi:hypothetical protein AX16_008384 [Volvariella volvacea WC 439]|nr:hypothetical protein AX16_008384 [Volvariella volvacea WC 439]
MPVTYSTIEKERLNTSDAPRKKLYERSHGIVQVDYLRDPPHNMDHPLPTKHQTEPGLKEGTEDFKAEIKEREAAENLEALGRIKKEGELAEIATEDSVYGSR